ncbi:hypothetical protein [Alicyclobacillus sp. ALC3]|uniref:hypothetical protein n=1 Tax=Alicyclobacillus sp. ALC3 TaxID=2796143 RepID=UPI0023793A04|nr:hypothetical protein [Alicyclobacillus sp. ALC3]WDL98130.1 hypothetical protein JC200_05360 [Alicyclobacillus sp. ALC3]
MARKTQTSAMDEGEVAELDGTLFFRCNRPLSIQEYMNLRAKVEMEEERSGRRIIILPHATDVVRT